MLRKTGHPVRVVGLCAGASMRPQRNAAENVRSEQSALDEA